MRTYTPSLTNCFAVTRPDATIASGNDCDFSFKLVHVFLSSCQNLSDSEDNSAEGAALNQITQSISRFGQREGLSHDRFDRAGLKKRDDGASRRIIFNASSTASLGRVCAGDGDLEGACRLGTALASAIDQPPTR
jgi:hypothetical protein